MIITISSCKNTKAKFAISNCVRNAHRSLPPRGAAGILVRPRPVCWLSCVSCPRGSALQRKAAGMRFKATNENLTIHLLDNEVEGCLRSLARALVPRFTQKLYVYAEHEQGFNLREYGLANVGPADLPSNFLQKFRIILRPGELVIVSGQSRFTRVGGGRLQMRWRSMEPVTMLETGATDEMPRCATGSTRTRRRALDLARVSSFASDFWPGGSALECYVP